MKKFFVAALAACAVFASCSKDNNGGVVSGPENGGPASLSLTMTFPRTYAIESASDEESKINTIDVFIFDAGDDKLINYKALLGTDFTEDGGVYTTAQTIATTAGERKIGVAINLPADIRETIVETVKDISAVETFAHGVTAAMIATANDFVMFNTVMPATTLKANDDPSLSPDGNTISMDIERLAAKAAMVTASGYDDTSTLGTFGTPVYKLMQTNTKSFLMRNAAGEDPNYLSSNFVVSGPTPAAPKYDASAFESATTYKAVGSIGPDHSAYPAFYGAENTSDFYQKGTSTYFLVKAQFTPTVFTDALGNPTTPDPAYAAGDPFWVVTDGTDTHICADEATARDLSLVNTVFPSGATYTEHVGGNCYWAVYIGNAGDRAFERNNYYLGQISAITGFGSGTEEDVIVPPEGPVDGTLSTLEVEFKVLDWTFKPADAVELD